MKVDSCNYFHGDDQSCDPINDKAEGRPPSCIGHVVGAVLPKILEAMAGVADHKQPGWPDDRGRGDDHKDRGHAALNHEHTPAAVSDCEADVNGRDQGDRESVDVRRVQPPDAQGVSRP
jgi:hypothetical protein